jgi:hypothetical protein
MHGTSHYTKYGGGGLLLMGYLYPFARASFCACSIPLEFLHHLICLLRTHTHVHVLCMQFRLTFCLCPHASTHESTPNQHLKEEILLGFGLELIMIFEFDPCL